MSVVGSGVTGQAGGVSKEAVPVARWLGTEVARIRTGCGGGIRERRVDPGLLFESWRLTGYER